jgi:hypothetical protein
MPSNFNETMDTVGSPDVGVIKEHRSYGEQIANAGKGIAGILDGMASSKQDAAFGAFANSVTEIESGVAQYAEQYSELNRQMASAEGATRTQFKTELDKLITGKVQGALTPTQARLKSDTLLKQYTSMHPAMAKQFRALSSESKGQYGDILREAFGSDPTAQLMNEVASRMRNGNVTEADVEMAVSQLEYAASSKYSALLSAHAQANGFSTTAADFDNAFKPMKMMTDNVRNILKSAGTMDQKLHVIKMMFDVDKMNHERTSWNEDTVDIWEGTLFATASDSQKTAAIAALAYVKSNPQKGPVFDSAVMLGLSQDNPALAMADFANRDPVMKQRLAYMNLDARVGGVGTPQAEMSPTQKMDGALAFDQLLDPKNPHTDATMRHDFMGKGIAMASWAEIKTLKNITREVAKDPVYVKQAIEKAAAEMVSYAEAGEVVMRPSVLNPIGFKGGTKSGGYQGDTKQSEALRVLNENYTFIMGAFGQEAVKELERQMGWDIKVPDKQEGLNAK